LMMDFTRLPSPSYLDSALSKEGGGIGETTGGCDAVCEGVAKAVGVLVCVAVAIGVLVGVAVGPGVGVAVGVLAVAHLSLPGWHNSHSCCLPC
jgi:hypothetical protein